MTARTVWRWSRRLGLMALAAALVNGLVRSRRAPAGPRIARCPLHGVSYDAELELCPECAKP